MLLKKATAEAVGTAWLLAVVVGSGIMGERLAGGNAAIALLANALATGAGLVALILTFGPISGAHLNPLVTLLELFFRRCSLRQAAAYVAAQMGGALLGVGLAHFMFDLPLWQNSTHARGGGPQVVSEVVATFGLVAVISSVAQSRREAVPQAVGAYITAAYWFTSSTSFANPAVTLARSFTNTFSGIRRADVPGFVVAQILGATLAATLFHWLLTHEEAS